MTDTDPALRALEPAEAAPLDDGLLDDIAQASMGGPDFTSLGVNDAASFDATFISRYPAARDHYVAYIVAKAAAEAAPLDVERLQIAMREARGRRISMTETYAEAIARRYNAALAATSREDVP